MAEDLHGLVDRVENDDERGQGVAPPPACEVIEQDTEEDGRGEKAVDERYPALGGQDRVAQGLPRASPDWTRR